jgi:hypothetical protein
VPNKIKVGEHLFSAIDNRLKTALQDWQSTQLANMGDNKMFGVQLIMTNNILKCLVGLAHSGKVSDLASIQTQVSWQYIDLWGAEILDILMEYFPPVSPPSPRPALQAIENIPGPSTMQASAIPPSGSSD